MVAGILILILSVVLMPAQIRNNPADSGFPSGNIAGTLPEKWGFFLGGLVFCLGVIFNIADMPSKSGRRL